MPASPALLWAICLLVAAVGIASQFFYMPHHDMAWLLYAAQQVMSGETLYASLMEVNPPLIVDLSAVGVMISSGLHVTRTHGWVIFVSIQALLSLWLTARLLARELADEAPDLAPPLIALVAWTFTCLPAREFGQREHLMVLWLSPYVVAAVGLGRGRPAGWPLQVLLGLLVGLAVCLKPYYGALVVLIEVFAVAWPARSIRPWFRLEMYVAAALGAAYIAFVRLEYPLFFVSVVPLAVQYYSAYGSTWLGVIKPAHLVYALATVVALGLGRTAPRGVMRLAVAFAIAGVGAYITLIVQSKGWSYHFLPAKSFLTIAMGVGALVFLRERLGQWAPFTLRRPGAVAMTARRHLCAWPRGRGRSPRSLRAPLRISWRKARARSGVPDSTRRCPRGRRDLGVGDAQESVEIVRAAFAAWNAGDMDAVREAFDPDAIMRMPEGWPEPGPFVGRDAVMRQVEQQRETWDSDSLELISDLIDVGDRVAVRFI